MRKFYVILMVFLCFGVSAFAQKRNIEGTVKTSGGESLPGSTIIVKGSTTGATCDIRGGSQ